MDIKVTGVDEFAKVARQLKELGDKDLRRDLYAGLNRSVKPLIRDVKDATGDYLPERGGHADLVEAELKVKSRKRSSRDPAIFLIGKAGSRDVASLNRGRVRHPLYGNRKRWYDTRIKPGFWSKTLEEGAPVVRREIVEVLRKIAAKIGR